MRPQIKDTSGSQPFCFCSRAPSSVLLQCFFILQVDRGSLVCVCVCMWRGGGGGGGGVGVQYSDRSQVIQWSEASIRGSLVCVHVGGGVLECNT